MPEFTIYGRRVTDYKYVVQAEDAEAAYDSMNEMIDDDFAPYITNNVWEFQVEEEEPDMEPDFDREPLVGMDEHDERL